MHESYKDTKTMADFSYQDTVRERLVLSRRDFRLPHRCVMLSLRSEPRTLAQSRY